MKPETYEEELKLLRLYKAARLKQQKINIKLEDAANTLGVKLSKALEEADLTFEELEFLATPLYNKYKYEGR